MRTHAESAAHGAADEAVREQALDPSRSISLEAPAGSGKTGILVQRFLGLLATVDEPEQVLAITFTRKAAGEMRERVMRALRGEEGPRAEPKGSTEDERLRERARAARAHAFELGWQLEASPARLRIQTIDALNRAIAARLPVAARGAGDLEVAEQPWPLYRSAARRALVDAESDSVLRADAELLFGRLDDNFGRCERLLAEMLEARAHWLPKLLHNAPEAEPGAGLCGRVEASLRAIVAERLSEAVARIPRELIVQGARIAQGAARRCEAAGRARMGPWRNWTCASSADALTLGHWQGLAQLALTRQGTWRRVLTPREGFFADERPLREEALAWLSQLAQVNGARETLIELARLPPPELAPEDAAALAALSRILQLAASELEVVFRESGRVDHTAIAGAARQALIEEGAPTDLALRLGTDIRHILVDEFQDTSIGQFQWLEALTATWEEGDGRTLFVVGDPMQSIYQFREAEVGLFLRASKYGLGPLRLQPLALTRNFRSAPELVAWTNRIFPQCFPQIDDARTSAVRYRPCIAGRGQIDGTVRWHPTPAGDAAAEASEIAALVASLQADPRDASIAILLTARSHAPPIVAALQAAQIGVAGVDLVALADLPVVRDLEALARALHHLGDRTAWLAVLRAPWCGLTLRELTQLTAHAPQRTLWEALNDEPTLSRLSSDACGRIARIRTVLARALERRDRLEPASGLESTWLQLGGPAACTSDADVDHARAFFRSLARWSSERDWTGPLLLEDRLDELYAAHAARADAVQVMTIHRAKGLQFDHVIVPGLGRKLRSGGEPLLRWLELPRGREGSDLLMAPIPPLARRAAHRLTEYLKSLQARRAAHERARLLYVAATRARSQLHLFGELAPADARSSASAPEPAPRSGTLLAALWPAVAADFLSEWRGGSTQTAGAGPASFASQRAPLTRFARLATDWHLPEVPVAPAYRSLEAATDEPTDSDGTPLPEHPAARVVCDQLRRCARQGRRPAGGEQESEGIASSLSERLARLGLAGAELEQEARRAVALWNRCAADSQLQWIFSTGHRNADAHFELSGLYGGRLATLAIDRTFVDDRDVRWLVNFRPGFVPTSADESAGVEVRREQLELERGITLGRALGTQEVRGGVYLVLPSLFREVRVP